MLMIIKAKLSKKYEAREITIKAGPRVILPVLVSGDEEIVRLDAWVEPHVAETYKPGDLVSLDVDVDFKRVVDISKP